MPSTSTSSSLAFTFIVSYLIAVFDDAPVAQLDRATASGAVGQAFESPQAHEVKRVRSRIRGLSMLKPKKGISKREIKEDKLVTTYFRSRAWFERNKRLVSYIIAAPVILLAILWFVENNRRQSDDRATTELSKVFPLYDQGQYQIAIDGIPQENIRGLQSIVDDYGSTHAGEVAKLYLAECYFNLKDYQKALTYFKEVDLSNKLLSSSVLAGEAACYEAEGNHEEAADLYEKAASTNMTDLDAPENLFMAANNYSVTGKKEKAAEMLKRIKREFPSSTYALEVDRFLAQYGVPDN